MYYIYAYIDPRTNLPFYIGKGTANRKFNHLKEHDGKTENRDKLAIIKELAANGLTPIITEIESNISSELMAYNREDYYILFYGRKGFEENGILTNKTIGGKHPPVPVWTDEKKKAHSEFNKQYWTAERKKNHPVSHSVNTISVTDLFGKSKRIPKDLYNSIDKTKPVETQEYVPVGSNESKRRKSISP